jgi:hypothetical protein
MIHCYLERQTRFADTSRADESDEPAIGIGKLVGQLGQFFCTTNEGSGGGG